MFNYFIKLISEFALACKIQKIIKINGVVKINLGCGLAVSPGWLNVDGSLNCVVSKFPRILIEKVFYKLSGSRKYIGQSDYQKLLRNNDFFYARLDRGFSFPDDSVDFFYTSHFLEHLSYSSAEKLLGDVYKSMKPGAVIRISVPSLDYALSFYDIDAKYMLKQYFYCEEGSNELSKHRFMYNYALLEELLLGVGFSKVSECAAHQGMVPDIDSLDNRVEESLYVEATK